ncbi:MAG: hypothetical protein AAF587_12185 [Bacteroidota bacterium]
MLAIFFHPSLFQVSLSVLGIVVGYLVVRGGRKLIGYLSARLLHNRLAPHLSVHQASVSVDRYVSRYGKGSSGRIGKIRQLLKEELLEKGGYKTIVIIGKEGSGKTSLMLRIYWDHLLKGWNRPYSMQYIKWSVENGARNIRAVKHPEKSILLLDGIDECLSAHLDCRTHLDSILPQTASFHKVVLSMRKGYLPAGMEGKSESTSIQYIGNSCFEIFGKVELREINPESLQSFRKDQHGWRLRRGTNSRRKTFQAHSHLLHFPLLLQMLGKGKASIQKLDKLEGPFLHPILSSYIHWEIGRTFPDPLQAKECFSFLNQLAQEFYRKYCEELEANAAEEELMGMLGSTSLHPATHFLAKTRLLDQRGNSYQFRHRMIWAYFLAWNGMNYELSQGQTRFEGLPMAKEFYQEMCWKKFLTEPISAQADYRVVGKVEKKPLKDLLAQDLLRINRLYLSVKPTTDMRFLRNLTTLEAVHLYDHADKQLPNQLIEELPHEQVLLHLHDPDSDNIQVVRFEEKQAELWLDNEKSIPIMARSLQKVDLANLSNPHTSIPYPGSERPSSKQLLELFQTNLQLSHPSGSWEERTFLGEQKRVIEMILGEGELDLFDRIHLIDMSDRQRNVVLYNNHRPTLMIQSLELITNQLYAVLGEDDDHQETFGPEDEAQIEDGYWLGRKWFWKNTDSYGHAVHLYMEKAGKVHLCIWGIDIIENELVTA